MYDYVTCEPVARTGGKSKPLNPYIYIPGKFPNKHPLSPSFKTPHRIPSPPLKPSNFPHQKAPPKKREGSKNTPSPLVMFFPNPGKSWDLKSQASLKDSRNTPPPKKAKLRGGGGRVDNYHSPLTIAGRPLLEILTARAKPPSLIPPIHIPSLPVQPKAPIMPTRA